MSTTPDQQERWGQVIKSIHYKSFLWLVIFLVSAKVTWNFQGTADLYISFKNWIEEDLKTNPIHAYNSRLTAYPPGYDLFADLLCLLLRIESIHAYKLALDLCSGLVSLLVWFRFNKFKISLFTLLLFMYSGSALGYGDVFINLFIYFMFQAIRDEKYVLASVYFSIAVNIKFTPLIILPVVISYISIRYSSGRLSINFKNLFKLGVGFALVEIPVLSIFGVSTYFENLKLGLQNGVLSGDALNLGWIVTAYVHILEKKGSDLVEPLWINPHGGLYLSMKFLTIVFTSICMLVVSSKRIAFEEFETICIFLVLFYFMIAPAVHENHLWFLEIVSISVLIKNSRGSLSWKLARFYILLSVVNLFVFFGLSGKSVLPRVIYGFDWSVIFALISLLIFTKIFVNISKYFLGLPNVVNKGQVHIP